MRVSYSALQTYKICPLKFKYQELDRTKVPKSNEAIFGTAVHSVLKKMFERTPLYPSLDELVDFFSQSPVKEISQEYFQEGISMLKNFYKKNPPWNFNVVELESRFGVILEDKENGQAHVLSGVVDRVDKNPAGDVYEIIDYKTAKRMPSQNDLDKDLQLSIYNLGLLKKWPHLKPEKIKLSLYFLKHNEKIATKRTADDLERTKLEILKIIREIEDLSQNNKEFIPTPSGLCDWCGYKKMCPMWKHLFQSQISNLKSQKDLELIVNEYFELRGQNRANNSRLKALQASICGFMDQEHIERVFGENGYLTRILQERNAPDTAKMKKALQTAGLWDEKEFVVKKQFSSLKATKKRGFIQKDF